MPLHFLNHTEGRAKSWQIVSDMWCYNAASEVNMTQRPSIDTA